MNELFGVSMTSIMYVLLAIFALSMSTVLYVFLRNRTMFKMGLRNLPRRGAQSSLVILGLMLATMITTAAFTTGDTVDHSITKAGYESLQRTDVRLNFSGNEDIADSTDAGTPIYVNQAAVETFDQKFAGDPDIEGFLPFLFEPVPAINQRTKLSEPKITLVGIDPARMSALGGLRLDSGGKADLTTMTANDIYLSAKAADELDARTGDVLTVYTNGKSADLRVAGIVKDEMATSGNAQFFAQNAGGGAVLLPALQALTGHSGMVNWIGIVLKGDVETSYLKTDSALTRLEPYMKTQEAITALGTDVAPAVQPIKQDSIEEAELTGNFFTTFFLILGLFSIASGVMLIFMIFVMMAAERKGEMAIARAVGAQRSNLIQSFLTEGMAYNVISGAVGAAFGVAAALALVVGLLQVVGGFDFISAKVTLRSLVISYCLGVVLTFLTVLVSSIAVSSVNIVAAIRGVEEDAVKEQKRRTNWFWVVLGLPTLIIPPLGIWLFFRKGWGLPWAWILGPLFFVFGILMILQAKSSGTEALFSIGFSILPIAVAMLASYYKAPGRLTWTLVGIYLSIYWLSPWDIGEALLGRELNGDIEMFLVSGVMVVVAFTLIIVFNARLLTNLFVQDEGFKYRVPLLAVAGAAACFAVGAALGDSGDGIGEIFYLFAGMSVFAAILAFAAARFSHLAPALKMGVAYPLANRFRTGMTIAMFSLIVFSLTVFSAINANFSALISGDDGDGGWDVIATSNRNNPVPDIRAALNQANAPVVNDIEYIGRVTTYTGQQQVRYAPEDGSDWHPYPVLAADSGFFSMPEQKLYAWANGYADEQAVFSAAGSQANLALVDVNILPESFNMFDYYIDPDISKERFEPFQMDVRDPVTNKESRVTVVGMLSSRLDPSYTSGLYVNQAAYQATFGAPEYQRSFIRLQDGVDDKDAAREIEAALATQGVQSDSIKELLAEAQQQQLAFMRMFQGFMALGLFAGIAALGVVAFRSVVERRQQIGMLRAIGYQASTVAITFVLESSFIAVMGILAGVVGGVIISRNLFASGEFGEGIQFFVPWAELMLFVGLAFAVSLVMTWYPSRKAAQVPVADALRYE